MTIGKRDVQVNEMSGNFENADASEDIASSASATLSTTSVSTPPEMRKEPNTAAAASLAAAAALRIAPPPPSVNPSAVIGSGSTPFPSILQSIPQTSSELTPPISDNLYGNPLWQTILRLQQYQNMASLNPFLAAAAAANTLSPDAAVAVAAVAAAQQQQQQQHQLQMATILAQAQAMQQAAASAAAAAAATSKPSTIHHPISPSTSTSVNINSPEENNSGINMGLYRDYLNKYAKTTSSSTSNATILSKSAQVVSKDNPLASQLFLSSGKLPSEQHLQHAAIQSMASSSTTTSNTSSLKLNIADLDPTSILTNATGTLNKLRSPICGGQSSQLASSPLPPKRQNSTSSSNTASSVPLFTSTAAMAATSSDYRSAAEGCGRGSSSITSHQNGRDKVFTCKICNRSFGYKHVLQNHERTHTGEKPFECKVCHKRFTRDHHLKTHMRLHTGEKPYHCTHCERQFVQVANLRRHLRVHTGEKPYKCDLCSSHFSDSNQLKAHILIHKGEKPFSCDHCSGKFRRRHHLMHHVCPKGGGGAGIIGEQDIQEDNMDDAIESEKTALLRKWPMPSPIVQPQPSSQSDKSECMESIEAPSAPVITMTDQKTGLLVQKQQQHQKIASIAITDTINPEVGVNVNSMSLFGIDTEKQRYRKAKDPKKRASNCTTAASGPILTSKQGNEETASVSSLEEVQGQTEPEDLSNKDSNN